MHTNLPQWNKWTVGRTTLRLSMQNREIEALCMIKHDECRGADLQLRLHQHITKCINMHQHASKWWNWAGRYKSTFLIIPQFLDVPWQFVFFFSAASQIGAQIRRGAAASIAGHPSGPRRGEALVLRGASDKNPLGQTSGSRDKMIRWWTDECVYAYILLHT